MKPGRSRTRPRRQSANNRYVLDMRDDMRRKRLAERKGVSIPLGATRRSAERRIRERFPYHPKRLTHWPLTSPRVWWALLGA
jgi:hypothetical protein